MHAQRRETARAHPFPNDRPASRFDCNLDPSAAIQSPQIMSVSDSQIPVEAPHSCRGARASQETVGSTVIDQTVHNKGDFRYSHTAATGVQFADVILIGSEQMLRPASIGQTRQWHVKRG